MAWRVAEALETLRKQLNVKFPGRDKSADGGIGDAAHASRSSDHNPWVQYKGMGIVTARDFTHDPRSGLDSEALAEALRSSGDPRIKYIISNRKICSGVGQEHPAWAWRPYPGKNPHNHHVHVSVKSDPVHFDDARPWNLDAIHDAKPQPNIPQTPAMPLLRRGMKGPAVKILQEKLGMKGKFVDGDFGRATEDAVREFQKQHHLEDDGIVGRYTWDQLGVSS